MPFRPRLWPTLFTVPAVLVMLGLGVWQMQRLAWKTDLIDTFEARVAEAPVAPPARIDDADAWRFRRVAATGRFLHDKELQLTGRTFEGNAGFHVLTPFVTDDGVTVLVNRGWVPQDLRRPEARPNTLVPPPARIDGIVRDVGVKGSFVPDNEPGNDIWFTVEPAAMARHLGLGEVANYSIDALRAGKRPTALPFGARSEITVRNEHLQYAVTWFLLAATLVVVYVVWHLQAGRRGGEAGS